MTKGMIIAITSEKYAETSADMVEVLGANVTPAEALALVCQTEKENIRAETFRMNSDDIDLDKRADNEASAMRMIAEVDNLFWPVDQNANAHLSINSIWAGGLDGNGIQYRYIPMFVAQWEINSVPLAA